MTTAFSKPDFQKRDIELRYESGVVCIYETAEGLAAIAKLCHELIDSPNIGHVHLEDYPILTPNSEKGAIAIFTRTGD
jgi:hypothetical protein